MLATEFGGMNEVFARLAMITGRDDFAAMALRFSHRAILEPLQEGRDALTGLHANTQIPKAVGYAISPDAGIRAAADVFWRTVVEHRSAVIGGNSVREHFHDPDDFAPMVEDREGPESCNTYNMLRLTRALAERGLRPEHLDWAERALFNHVLSAQHPERGGFVYFTSLRPQHYRVYSTVDQCFWCCVGTGIESQARYGEWVFGVEDGALAINLFVPATLDAPEFGGRVRVETEFPNDSAVTVVLDLDAPRSFPLRLRVPAWASGLDDLAVDGEPVEGRAVPGAIVIERVWQPGARITFRVPLVVRAERLPDGSPWQAFLAGPIVLAARDSDDGLVGLRGDDQRWGHVAGGPLLPLADVPIVTDAAASELLTETAPLRYRLRTADPADDVELEPFAGIHDARYTVYWPVAAGVGRGSPSRAAGARPRRARDHADRTGPLHPLTTHAAAAAAGEDTMITIAEAPSHLIDRRVYGQFAEHLGRCIYEGLWVGAGFRASRTRTASAATSSTALRAIKVPVVRWPGGCFADEYHWLKGVGPERQSMVNTHWGGVVEPNTFGTHEYFELLNQLDAEAYINGNVGSGTVAEMADWVEYMTLDTGSPMADLRKRHGRDQPFRLEFFGVGNESWGCGGNMLPLHYANLYRQYQTYVRKYGEHPISKIACGANADDYEWTEVLMARAAGHMDGLSLHYYTLPTGEWDVKGAATGLRRSGVARDDPPHPLHGRAAHPARGDHGPPRSRASAWGSSSTSGAPGTTSSPAPRPGFLYQQNTIRDAVAAAINLHIFHKHGSRVRMANIAQMVNVLQSMLLTDGPRLVKTPTYHVFDLYSDHQDAEWVDAAADDVDPFLDWTVSRKDGAYTIGLVNTGLEREASVTLPAAGGDRGCDLGARCSSARRRTPTTRSTRRMSCRPSRSTATRSTATPSRSRFRRARSHRCGSRPPVSGLASAAGDSPVPASAACEPRSSSEPEARPRSSSEPQARRHAPDRRCRRRARSRCGRRHLVAHGGRRRRGHRAAPAARARRSCSTGRTSSSCCRAMRPDARCRVRHVLGAARRCLRRGARVADRGGRRDHGPPG